MALKFVEGWELYDGTGSPPSAFSSKWGTVNKNYLLDLTTGKSFGYGMRFGKDWSGTADYALTPTLGAQGSWIVGLRLRRDTAARDGQFLRVYDGATIQLEFRLSGTNITVYRGGSTLIHTFSSVLSDTGATTWHHLQFKFTISTTVGSVECRYNNFDVGTDGANLNTDAAASGEADKFMLTATQSAYRTSDFSMDDFWVCDTTGTRNNNWLGPLVIEAIYPNGDGYQSDWVAEVSNKTVVTDHYAHSSLTSAGDVAISFGNPSSMIPPTFYEVGPRGANHGVTVLSFKEFGVNYNVYETTSNFLLSYYTSVGATHTFHVKIAAGNVSHPTNGTELSGLWTNPLTNTVSIVNPINNTGIGPSTIDISSLITEWQAQVGWDENWDLHVMFGRTPGDTSDNFMRLQPNSSTEYRQITFDSTATATAAVVSSSEDDFIKSSVVGDIQSFTLEEPSYILGNVRAVVVNWSGRKGGPSDSIDMRSFVRSGITNGYGSTKEITSPYPAGRYIDIYELNPEAGGVPWAREHISNIEVGVELEG